MKIILAIIFLALNVNFLQAQVNDSIYTGKQCLIVLLNGFEAEGKITQVREDTVWIQTEQAELKIPISQIKYVDTLPEEYQFETFIDTTDECDVYLEGRSLLKDVRLLYESDSTLIAIKKLSTRNIKYADIRKIVFKPNAPFGYGFLYGGGIGFLSGFLAFAFAEGGGHPDFSGPGVGIIAGLILAVPTGLVGGLVGLLVARDDIYNFDKGSSSSKVKRIKYIMKKHS